MSLNKAHESHSHLVASFATSAEAEAFVDALGDSGFPVHHAAILGRYVSTSERVVGRLDARRAAFHGGVVGALYGSLLGVAVGVLSADNGREFFALWLLWIGIGASFSALWTLAFYLLSGRSRNLKARPILTAAQYDVMVHESVADRAEQWLAEYAAPPDVTSPDVTSPE